ncbi:MAG: hypothetical protein ABI444_07985 [Candidatus Kapaibacterium sp.]|jgi:hypothetical protein
MQLIIGFKIRNSALALLLVFGLMVRFTSSVQAQGEKKVESRTAHYMRHGRLVARIPLTFPGPGGGYTMAHVPVKEISKYGDTVSVMHAFLLDFGTANEGNFFPPDTMKASSGYSPFELDAGAGHLIHLELVPSAAHPEYKSLDSTYFGTLGYAFFNKFVTTIDFEDNTMSLYTLYSTVEIGERDTLTLQLNYLDDAVLTYCHCHFPTVWLDGEAPPFKPGHVHVSLATPQSVIYWTSLDVKTKKLLEKEFARDSLTGRKPKPGISVATFRVGGKNIASRAPHRLVEDYPPVFKDLSVSVLGTLATDVLRTFKGMIFDPTGKRLLLVR